MFSNAHQPPKLYLRPAKFNRKKLQRVKRTGGRELWERIGVSELEEGNCGQGTGGNCGKGTGGRDCGKELEEGISGPSGQGTRGDLEEGNWRQGTVGKELEEGKCG